MIVATMLENTTSHNIQAYSNRSWSDCRMAASAGARIPSPSALAVYLVLQSADTAEMKSTS
jgi:hypothetical protein